MDKSWGRLSSEIQVLMWMKARASLNSICESFVFSNLIIVFNSHTVINMTSSNYATQPKQSQTTSLAQLPHLCMIHFFLCNAKHENLNPKLVCGLHSAWWRQNSLVTWHCGIPHIHSRRRRSKGMRRNAERKTINETNKYISQGASSWLVFKGFVGFSYSSRKTENHDKNIPRYLNWFLEWCNSSASALWGSFNN